MWSQRGSPAGTHSTLSSPPASSTILNIATGRASTIALGCTDSGSSTMRVQRVAVLAQGVLDEAVVGRVAHRGVEVAVQPQPASVVVHLVLVAATLLDLDGHVKFQRQARWVSA